MQEKIIQKLEDPFDLKNLAPRGYDFLMSASLGPHVQFLREQQAAFYANAISIREDAETDYIVAALKSLELSHQEIEFNDSLSEALFRRTSTREFAKAGISFDVLSFYLKLSAGLKGSSAKRFYPSGGGLYSLRVYVLVRDVHEVEPGVYLFNPFKNSLDLINDPISPEDRWSLHNKTYDLSVFQNSSFEILITTRPQIALRKYGEHGWKIILMEMGHLAQNFILVGSGCGIACFPCSGLNLAQSEKVLRTFATGELLLYSIVCGKAG